jgi:enoyl-[acyl-carrier-protein] reductase (NADH)
LAQIAARDGVSLEEAERRLGANSSIGRIVDAAEVADIVAFLSSPRSAAITGDAIACGGGTRGAIYY